MRKTMKQKQKKPDASHEVHLFTSSYIGHKDKKKIISTINYIIIHLVPSVSDKTVSIPRYAIIHHISQIKHTKK